MTQGATHNKANSPLSFYKQGWSSLLHNWKAILLCYSVNLLIVFVGMGPLSQVIKGAVEKTHYAEAIAGPFDYTLLMDIANNHGAALKVGSTFLITLAVPFFLWAVFCSGGFMKLMKTYPNRTDIKTHRSQFWSGGAEYFFRYLRLGLYVILLTGTLLCCLAVLFLEEGLTPMNMDTENAFIFKMKMAAIVFAVTTFVLTIFRELAKAKIASSDDSFILKSNLAAAKETLSPRVLLLALINLVVLLLGAGLYFLLKKITGGALIPAVIVGQLFLLFRMATRYVKQASFMYNETANSDHV